MRAATVGLVPAAGRATRLGRREISKETQPVGESSLDLATERVVSQDLLDGLAVAGIRTAFVIIRKGKWDIPALYGPGPPRVDLRLAWLVTPGTSSVPESLDIAYPFVGAANVVTGFPDIRFRPIGAIAEVAKRYAAGSQMVLGLFPSDRPDKTDMVEVAKDGRILRIHVKPGETGLDYTWIFAAWGPVFTRFLHAFVTESRGRVQNELHTSEVLQAAADEGMRIDSVQFDEGIFLDIGTPDDLDRLKEIDTSEWSR